MSSLFKRAALPLLAVAAAATLCIPARAATASFDPCQVVNQGTPYAGIRETVDCHFTMDAIWNEADFHCTLLGGNGANNYEAVVNNINAYCGVGDYTYSTLFMLSTHGTYNCWCVCSGTDYYGAAWNASTGGTYYVSF